jgi:hypothetical protein
MARLEEASQLQFSKYYNKNINELRDDSLEYSTTVVMLRSQRILLWQQPSLVSQIFLAHL